MVDAWFCLTEVIHTNVFKCIVKTTRQFPIYFEQNEVTEYAEQAFRFSGPIEKNSDEKIWLPSSLTRGVR